MPRATTSSCIFPTHLYPGKLIRRYQRFLADVELADGTVVTAHCPNTGSMRGCNLPGSPVFLSSSSNPARKYHYTWELVQADGCWVGLNTLLPNRLVREGIENGVIGELAGYPLIRPEVKYGENSRIDLLLEGPAGRCYVEVKNVTMVAGGIALFPDAVTERGQKHLRELMEVVRNGERGVIFFVVQRADGTFALDYDRPKSIGRLKGFQGHFGILARGYTYIRMHGPEGLRTLSETAVLNANYLKALLSEDFDLAYDRSCMHEFVLSGRRQKTRNGVRTLDIAKRLLDFGIHPPTIYFPLIVDEAIMIEPTESESRATLDHFVAVMRQIARECEETPELVRDAPRHQSVGRLDEVTAARKPILRWT